MEIVSLVLLAAVLGFIYSKIQPKLAAAVPASVPQNAFTSALLTGGFILVAFFLANLVLGFVGMRRKG